MLRISCVLLSLLATQLWAAEVKIASGGRAALPIIISQDASEEVRQSARDLAATLERMTNAKFVVEPGDGSRGIVVGTAQEFPALVDGATFAPEDTMRLEEYLLRSSPGRMALIGATPRGTDYAVWDFLHRLGYRQYFPAKEWEIVPKKPELSVEIDRFERPDYIVRSIWAGFGMWEENKKENEQWKRKNRMSSVGFVLNTGHVWDAIIRSMKDEIAVDPSLVSHVDGKATNKLNVGNPEARELAVQFALAALEKKPGMTSISMDPSDGGGWGSSPEELAIGSPSDRVLLLANEVAQAVGERFGNKYVGIYAYNQHAAPPTKVRANPRVIVSFATRFIKDGLVIEDVINGWAKAGVKLMGIREYYSVLAWDADLPGRPHGAQLDYVVRTIPWFHKKGARFMSAEAGDNWGPTGLGYYLASRLLWDTREVESADAVIAEFVGNCFPEATEPMTRLYREIMHPNGKRLLPVNADTIGKMFRLLKEARESTTDEEAMRRLDSLVLLAEYTRGVIDRKKEGEQGSLKKIEERLKFVYRIRSSGMVHSYGQWRAFGDAKSRRNRERKEPFPAEADFRVPEGENPWKSSQPYSREEIESMVEKGIADHPLRDFEPVAFSRNLVRATRIPSLEGIDEPVAITHGYRGNVPIYTEIDDPAVPLTFEATPGVIYKGAFGDTHFDLYAGELPQSAGDAGEVPEAEENAALFEEPVATAVIPSDKNVHVISLKAERPGLHIMQLRDGMSGTRIAWPRERPFTLEFSDRSRNPSMHRFKMYFYVPKGTRNIGGFTDRGGKIFNPDGEVVLDRSRDKTSGYFNLPVAPGDDGRCWKYEAVGGIIRLLTVPPFLSPSISQLLLPIEVVEADSKE